MSSLLLRSGLERGEDVCMYVCMCCVEVCEESGGRGGREIGLRTSIATVFVCMYILGGGGGGSGEFVFWGGRSSTTIYTHTHTQRETPHEAPLSTHPLYL